MKLYFVASTLIFSMFYRLSSSFSILVIFPHEGKSHQWVFEPIVRKLLDRGHKITALVHHSLNVYNNVNYSEIILRSDNAGYNRLNLESFYINRKIVHIGQTLMLKQLSSRSCHNIFTTPGVMEFIKTSKLKFDVLFVELFNNECSWAFKELFGIPNVIGISSTSLMPWHFDRFGQPLTLSYVSHNHIWLGGKHLNFLERVENVLATWWYKFVFEMLILPDNQEICEKYLSRKLNLFSESIKSTSLVLVNSHWSLHHPFPSVPAVVEIGGVHISKSKELPLNIEKFINESTHGVIYFSLGSMIKGHTFPQEKREEFLKAFARLPQRVLWKWENETMPGKPDNVMIQKWMPQFDILSHPNVKAFISHGGLLGVTEAVHCGVPMMVMPQYGDQHTNAKAVEANGGGVILYLRDATEEKVYQNLKTILDPEFREKAKALSERFRDRPMSPMDTAIYWVEYVARHKGAPHLRTAAVDMPLYQYLLLDVFAFLAAVLLVSLYVTYKISSLIFRSIFSKKKVKQS